MDSLRPGIQAREQVEGGQRGGMNLLEIAAARIAGHGVGQQQLAESTNDRELILEVVTALFVVRFLWIRPHGVT